MLQLPKNAAKRLALAFVYGLQFNLRFHTDLFLESYNQNDVLNAGVTNTHCICITDTHALTS